MTAEIWTTANNQNQNYAKIRMPACSEFGHTYGHFNQTQPVQFDL